MIEIEKASSNLYWHRLRLAEILNISADALALTDLGGSIRVQFRDGELPDGYIISKETIESAFDETPPKTTEEEIEEIQDTKIIETLERVKERAVFKEVFEPLIKSEIEKDKIK
jgi:hypothetical protein